MTTYRLKDLVLAPSLLSLARIPLGLAFPMVGESPPIGIGLLLVAGMTDVADGWVARRWNLVTDTGAVVDGVADKVLAASVMASLIVWQRLTGLEALLLATRELLELPLLVWLVVGKNSGRRSPSHSSTANRSGKITTMLQLASIAAALVHHPATLPLAAAAGVVGAFAGLRYVFRALAENRRALRPASSGSA